MSISVWKALYAFALPLFLGSSLSAATLKDIHRDKLPQDVAVQAALDRVLPIEELVDHWSGAWNASVSKQQVQATLGIGISSLQRAVAANPKNEEIFLALALLNHYAYNVDMDGAEDAIYHALDAARVLSPDDDRTAWFAANHHCQTLEAIKGMQELLVLEAAKPWQQQPQGFWDDYLTCTVATNLPAHGLRAYDRMKQVYPVGASRRDNLRDMLLARSVTSDVNKHYTAKQVWMMESTKTNVTFTSFACGMSFSVRSEAPIQSATIVWKALYNLGIEKRTILWNALQMHPHKPGNKQSNRTPTSTEIAKGKPALQMLVAAFPSAKVVAVGKKAEGLLSSMGVVTAATVRHPANGGATAFAHGLELLVGGAPGRPSLQGS